MMEDDVTFMYKRSRYVTGLSQEIGGMGETSIPAALGKTINNVLQPTSDLSFLTLSSFCLSYKKIIKLNLFVTFNMVGVISAMEGALDYLSMGGLAGKTVAIQGAGNVGVYSVIKSVIYYSTYKYLIPQKWYDSW